MEKVIAAIEEYCNEQKIVHRFVGGVAYAGLLNKDTMYTIDIEKRTVSLKKHNQLSATRADGTVRDIDLIVFTPHKQQLQLLKKFIRQLPKQLHLKKAPHVSVEAAIYPSLGKVSPLLQFVTSIQVNQNGEFGTGHVYLVFDNIRTQINWQSLEAWQIILASGQRYTVRHPYADFLAYHFRMPSGLKPKDAQKVKLMVPLIEEVYQQGVTQDIDYLSEKYYAPWLRYIRALYTAKGLTELKAHTTRWYWSTIGTAIAHGKGPINQLLLNLSNQFTGISQ